MSVRLGSHSLLARRSLDPPPSLNSWTHALGPSSASSVTSLFFIIKIKLWALSLSTTTAKGGPPQLSSHIVNPTMGTSHGSHPHSLSVTPQGTLRHLPLSTFAGAATAATITAITAPRLRTATVLPLSDWRSQGCQCVLVCAMASECIYSNSRCV